MDKYTEEQDMDLEITIENATENHWAVRHPTPEEAANRRHELESGEDRRLDTERLKVVCIGWEYDRATHRLWTVWQEQQMDDGGEWQELNRFPRLADIRLDMQGFWEPQDCNISEDSPEWRYLAPPALRTLVADRPRG